MEEKSVNNVVVQSDSDCENAEEQHSSISCSSVKMGSSNQSSTDCVDLKHSDVQLVNSPSTSDSGQESSAQKQTSGGSGRTRKEKPSPLDNSKGSTRKINKFWNFLFKKKLSSEVNKCDLKKVSHECVDEQSTMVSCLCTGLRHFQLRVDDEEMAASDCEIGDDDNDTTDVINSCQASGLSSADGSGVHGVPGESRMHKVPQSAQRRSLPADPSFTSAAVAVDDVTELLRSMTRQEDSLVAFGHRATYPHLSYGADNSSCLASSAAAAAAAAASDAECSSHTWTTNPRSFESNPVHSSQKASATVNNEAFFFDSHSNVWKLNMGFIPQTIHTQVDYIHCLVPDLKKITNCSYYWGIMDRYEAERLLDNRPEGTFLLRDSAQEEFLFSVSFRRYSRSLHARVEQWNHKFSFDSHDPSVYASLSVCGLVEHYKDPACCMFFEPMLTLPLVRTFPFSLQHLCRAAICSMTTYDGVSYLPLPKSLHQFLQYYHYKQKVRVRRFETLHT